MLLYRSCSQKMCRMTRHYSSPTIKLGLTRLESTKKTFFQKVLLSFLLKTFNFTSFVWILIQFDSGTRMKKHKKIGESTIFSLFLLLLILLKIRRSRRRAFFRKGRRRRGGWWRLWPTLVPIFLLSPDRKNDDGNGEGSSRNMKELPSRHELSLRRSRPAFYYTQKLFLPIFILTIYSFWVFDRNLEIGIFFFVVWCIFQTLNYAECENKIKVIDWFYKRICFSCKCQNTFYGWYVMTNCPYWRENERMKT